MEEFDVRLDRAFAHARDLAAECRAHHDPASGNRYALTGPSDTDVVLSVLQRLLAARPALRDRLALRHGILVFYPCGVDPDDEC